MTFDANSINESSSEFVQVSAYPRPSVWTHMRDRLAFVGVSMMFLSLLTGGISLASVSPLFEDFVKAIAVALFVCSMVALAIGMVGGTRHDRQ